MALDADGGWGGSDVAVFGLFSASSSPTFVRADRRGGGRLGLGFSSSCCSRADTNDDGEEGISWLLIAEDSLRLR